MSHALYATLSIMVNPTHFVRIGRVLRYLMATLKWLKYQYFVQDVQRLTKKVHCNRVS